MKKLPMILCVILNLLAIALIPMNLFLWSMPEAVSIAAAVCIIAVNVWRLGIFEIEHDTSMAV